MAVGRSPRARLADLEARMQPAFRDAWQRFWDGGALPEHPHVRRDVVALVEQLAEVPSHNPGGCTSSVAALLERAQREQAGAS